MTAHPPAPSWARSSLDDGVHHNHIFPAGPEDADFICCICIWTPCSDPARVSVETHNATIAAKREQRQREVDAAEAAVLGFLADLDDSWFIEHGGRSVRVAHLRTLLSLVSPF